ncbi:hypothetical protein AJ79_00781 [Helicocarpus griseus UAMH5409]|uniref:Glycosyl hydrolase n=1 Tax=Helicocarpus griseus UAMH5409 TaxID=1447875 RepID=A0A2B7YAJ1_9EURO|nr:hypothetical protein AJ79_00781 [Helicocarpus griseus UAMH5409]
MVTSALLTCLFFFSYTKAQSDFRSYAEAGLAALQKWYNPPTGLWETTGWWNSGNCLTTVAEFAAFNAYAAEVGNSVFTATFTQGQQANVLLRKKVLPSGLVDTYYLKLPDNDRQLRRRGFPGFINNYYDDEGWWTLGWIRVYDITGDLAYLQMARDIFEDMTTGWDNNRCGGGIWWDKYHTSLVAIANELFLSAAAHLATRVPDAAEYYLDWARREWDWFQQVGLINPDNNINDGVNLETCTNNGATVWSYNQGVILGALVEFTKASPEGVSFIPQADAIATAAITALTDENGILHDGCEPNCGADGPQFKGIFMRGLRVLHQAAPKPEYQAFLERNAESIWANRNEVNEFGVNWAVPFEPPALASTQSSALDALVAAAAIQARPAC